MSLFGRKEKQTIKFLEKELAKKDKRINQLVGLCNIKDEFFKGSISDGLRHGSSQAGRHMAERKKYLKGK